MITVWVLILLLRPTSPVSSPVILTAAYPAFEACMNARDSAATNAAVYYSACESVRAPR